MRRFLFFILMAAAVIGSSFVVLMSVKFASGDTGFDLINKLFTDIFNGTVELGFATTDFVLYGLIVFSVINIAILFTMAVMFLMNFGMLGRIFKFFSISGWFLISALVFTIPYVLWWFNQNRANHANQIPFNIMMAVPFACAAVMFVLGFIIKRSEKKG